MCGCDCTLLFVLQKWLVGAVITKEKIDEAAAILEGHLGSEVFNYDGIAIYKSLVSVCTQL